MIVNHGNDNSFSPPATVSASIIDYRSLHHTRSDHNGYTHQNNVYTSHIYPQGFSTGLNRYHTTEL